MGPAYPSYPSQMFRGKLPSMQEVGPSDLRYSSGTAPFYQSAIDAAHGRQLAGLGADVQDEQANQGWALNELKVMAEADDVQGDGIFDPPGTRPNIYPDAGVLAARFGIPGYLARERMFAPSEVVDVTTGRPVVYVNSGAVSMDSAAQIAFLERGQFQPPVPVIGAAREHGMKAVSTVNVMQNPYPVGVLRHPGPMGAYDLPSRHPGAMGQTENRWMTLGVLALVGLAAGGAYAVWRGKKKRAA